MGYRMGYERWKIGYGYRKWDWNGIIENGMEYVIEWDVRFFQFH